MKLELPRMTAMKRDALKPVKGMLRPGPKSREGIFDPREYCGVKAVDAEIFDGEKWVLVEDA